MPFLDKVRKVIGRAWEVGKRIGGFVARNHQTIAPLAMGLAEASGNETLKQVAGVGLAASQIAQMGAGNYLRQRIADYRSRAAPSYPQPAVGVPVGEGKATG